MRISAEDNLIRFLEIKAVSQQLVIRTRKNVSLIATKPVIFDLGVKHLREVELSGAGDLSAPTLDTGQFLLVLTGSGDVEVPNLHANEHTLLLFGVGNVFSSGKVDGPGSTIAGSGSYEAVNLASRKTEIVISGAGFWVFQRSSRVLEDHREMPPPRHALARLVESSFPQNRVVAALVAMHDKPFRLEVADTRCVHTLAIPLCGRSGVQASQLLGEPAIATMGQYGQGGVTLSMESSLTRHTSEVQAMHAAPQPVCDAMAAGGAHHQRPRPLLGVVGEEPGRLRTAQARDRPWAPRALGPWEVDRLLQGPDTLRTAGRRVDPRLAPWASRERAPAAPEGDTPEAALVQWRPLGRGHDLSSKVSPLRMDSGAFRPTRDTLERRASLGTPGERRVGKADDLALVLVRAEAPHTGPGLATPGQVVLGQPSGIAPQRARVRGQGAGVGVRKHPRRHGAAPA